MTGFQIRASGCCPRSGEVQEGLGVVLLMRWHGERFVEWFVEPGHQIAMGKEIHAQKRHQVGEAPAETGGQLQITQQQHRDQCCPNLSLDRIRRRADKGA
jgi:hypothetical protein